MSLHLLLRLYAWCVCAGLLGLGTAACWRPALASRAYGVAVEGAEALAWVRATGLRDVALGAILAPFLWNHADRSAGVVLGVTGALAVFDLVNAASRRAPWPALAFHGGGAVSLVCAGIWMLARA